MLAGFNKFIAEHGESFVSSSGGGDGGAVEEVWKVLFNLEATWAHF